MPPLSKLTREKVIQYRPWVRKIVNKSMQIYPRNPRWDADDLESEAWVGFMTAWQAFDKSYGVPFKAYARRQIINNIQKFFSANVFTLHALYDNVKHDPDKLTKLHDTEVNMVREFKSDPSENDEPLEVIPSGYYNPENDAIAREQRKIIRDTVNAIEDGRTKKIIRLKYVEDKNLQEIGKEVNLTPERVRTILLDLNGILKERFAHRGLN